MEDNPVFRKVALDRLASPEQLDSLLTVTRPLGWLALLGIALVAGAAVLWGIMGTIPIKVTGQGILIRGGGMHQITPISAGRLTDVRVKEGDTLERGQVVARIARPDLAEALEKAYEKVQDLQSRIAASTGDEMLHAELIQAEATLARLQEEYLVMTRVVSPANGRVLEVRKKIGDFIALSEPLASYESIRDDQREFEAALFVPAEQGQRILPGMDVHVMPLNADVEAYGFILGKVVSVSEFPVSRQGMLNVLVNEELVDRFMESGALVEVKVEMAVDHTTPSGFRWSAGDGPPNRIQSGTLMTAEIVVEEKRPISMVLPVFD